MKKKNLWRIFLFFLINELQHASRVQNPMHIFMTAVKALRRGQNSERIITSSWEYFCLSVLKVITLHRHYLKSFCNINVTDEIYSLFILARKVTKFLWIFF